MKRASVLTASLVLSLFTLLFFSCIPARKYEEMEIKYKGARDSLNACKDFTKTAQTLINELKAKQLELEKQKYGLEKDTNIIGTNLRHLTSKYDKLNQVNEQLLAQLAKLTANATNENKTLVGQLQMTQDELLKKEDELKKLQIELEIKKKNLDDLSRQLADREKRIQELEDLLKKKDDAIKDLKKKISDALVGFEGNGLTITQKNGKIYVSMDESLLFSSGSTTVQPKGVDALKKLGKVLDQNSDVNIMVEGHTDDQPMKGTGEIKDNWDLSVMRATSVTKILLNTSNIDAKRITAAGRGEYFPVDPGKTAEARKKNRRTEIILSPKLDDLLKVLESN